MLLRTPDFYHKFHCVADKCTDCCCIGWEIGIDPGTMEKYRRVPGAFGEELRAKTCNNQFTLEAKNRCPFLNADGLCRIISNLGESYLGDTCREHPRFVEVYGDVMEKGIGLCCEEGVRLLLDCSGDASTFNLVESEVNEPEDDIPDDAREARDMIFAERQEMFRILEQREIPLNQRLQMLLELVCGGEDCDPNTAPSLETIHKQWIKVLGKGESYGLEWDEAYKRITRQGWGARSQDPGAALFSDDDGARIVAYMLFRYYAKSLFDGDSLGKVQFAIFFWMVLKKFEIARTRIDAVKLLSKQIEYSDEVMNLLAGNFANNDAFSVPAFLEILSE